MVQVPLARSTRSRSRLLVSAGVWGAVAVLLAIVAVAALNRPPARPELRLTREQAAMVDQLASVLQFDNALLQYGRAEDPGDGRGFVAGRDGFGTADGGVTQVVDEYTDEIPANPLAPYLPVLRVLSAQGSDDVTGLAGFADQWRAAAAEPTFRAVQDRVDEDRAVTPTLDRAHELGLRTALGYAVVYDAVLQQGTTGVDGVDAMIATATAAAHGRPVDGVDEHRFLGALLDARAGVLVAPADPRRRPTWAHSTGRVSALRALLDRGADSLSPPLVVNAYGTVHVLYPLVNGPGPAELLAAPTGPPVTATPAPPASSAAAAGAPPVVTVASAAGLRDALAAARPGQTISLADGTYAGVFAATVSGTAGAPITLTGSPAAILTSSGYGFRLAANYWRLTGFTIDTASKGLVLDQASHNTVTGLTIRHTQAQGAYVRTGSSDNVFNDNRISDTGTVDAGSGRGVTVGNSASSWPTYTGGEPDRSDRNRFVGNHFGPDTRGGAMVVYEGSTGGTVQGNTFDGTGIVRGGAWVTVRGNGYQFLANTGTGSPADGFQVLPQPGGWGCGTVFRSNRMDVRADGYGVRVLTPDCGTAVYASNVALNAGGGLTNIAVKP